MTPEFSRRHRLTSDRQDLVLRATAAECVALAARFAILGIDAFDAQFALAPEPGGTTRLRGTLRASVRQECVVTFEPVAQQVEAPLDLRILPDGTPPTDDDPESPDEIESTNGFVDLGEVVAQQLALALDPYPRAPDAGLPPELTGEALPTRPNPFAVLGRKR